MLQVGQTPAPDFPMPPPWVTLPPPVVLLMGLALVAGVVAIFWPLIRAIGRRIESKGRHDPALMDELEQLRHRLSDVEAMQSRIAELEERVDFAERLLAQKRQPEQLGP